MPRKVQKAISEFEISIDNEEFTVYWELAAQPVRPRQH
jgi:hypothetical protein